MEAGGGARPVPFLRDTLGREGALSLGAAFLATAFLGAAFLATAFLGATFFTALVAAAGLAAGAFPKEGRLKAGAAFFATGAAFFATGLVAAFLATGFVWRGRRGERYVCSREAAGRPRERSDSCCLWVRVSLILGY